MMDAETTTMAAVATFAAVIFDIENLSRMMASVCPAWSPRNPVAPAQFTLAFPGVARQPVDATCAAASSFVVVSAVHHGW
jgi:hypothetical protein